MMNYEDPFSDSLLQNLTAEGAARIVLLSVLCELGSEVLFLAED
jgi:hypothetical protein